MLIPRLATGPLLEWAWDKEPSAYPTIIFPLWTICAVLCRAGAVCPNLERDISPLESLLCCARSLAPLLAINLKIAELVAGSPAASGRQQQQLLIVLDRSRHNILSSIGTVCNTCDEQEEHQKNIQQQLEELSLGVTPHPAVSAASRLELVSMCMCLHKKHISRPGHRNRARDRSAAKTSSSSRHLAAAAVGGKASSFADLALPPDHMEVQLHGATKAAAARAYLMELGGMDFATQPFAPFWHFLPDGLLHIKAYREGLPHQ